MNSEIKAPRLLRVDELSVRVYANRGEMSRDAAREVHEYLTSVMAQRGEAAIILATGNSQIEFLKNLIGLGGIDWSRVTCFHMDEYLGMKADHKASFRRYLKERVETLVNPRAFHYIQGDAPLPLDECERYSRLLQAQPIDLCCLGVGENGHLAFNDPPVARFDDHHLIKLVQLDDDCKMQQVKEGHFPSLEAVPPYAYTLTIPALAMARKLVCVAPESRKAEPVRRMLKGPIDTSCPASYLRTQSKAVLLLDEDSAKLL